ncbi:unnamed protein product [Linum trigynum]|uniref:Uncharacterized protein n=1 Tax=Linum trigynum TaxID=586398 RepID=A0AAV2GCE5_9ROSI
MKGERRVGFAAVELAQQSLLTTKGKRFSTVDLAIPSRSEQKSVTFPPPPTDLVIPFLSFLTSNSSTLLLLFTFLDRGCKSL